jgi:hypothetical protein
MIVVVVRYSTIPLEMSIGIVYGPPMDNPTCDITWKTCTRERWDPDQPYGVIAKGFHTWPVRGAHVCRVGQVYTPAGLIIDSNLRDTLGYE